MLDAKGRLVLVLIFEGILALGLAVVADKLAEIISLRLPELVSEPNVWLLATSLVALSAVTGILSLRTAQAPMHLRTIEPALSTAAPESSSPTLARLPIFWLLPFATALAAGVSFLAILSAPTLQVMLIWPTHAYELVTWAVGTAAIVMLVRRKVYRTLLPLLAFAIGYALGAAAMILFLRSQENDLLLTTAGWLLSMLVTGSLLRVPEIQRLLSWPRKVDE